MSDNQTLEVTQSAPNNDSSPAEEVNTKVETEAPEGAEEAKVEKPLTEAEKIRHSMQKRIDRQTAATKTQQERISLLERQVAEAAARAPKEDDMPKESDFDTWEDFDTARVKHLAKKEAESYMKAEREKELKTAQERQHAETQRQFMDKEAKYKATVQDYDRYAKEAVETMNLMAQTGTDISSLRDAVMQFDNPPKMIYQLGKDTSLIEELAPMPPLKIMRELLKLEASLTKEPDSTKEAPTPIRSSSGKGGVKPLDQRSGEEILKWVKSK